jgi:UTP-glucose-1-phosphate uridylyltransferase
LQSGNTSSWVESPNATSTKAIPLRCLIEKPDSQDSPSNLVVLGRYIFFPKILGLLASLKSDVDNEIQLTDAIIKLVSLYMVLKRIHQSNVREIKPYLTTFKK